MGFAQSDSWKNSIEIKPFIIEKTQTALKVFQDFSGEGLVLKYKRSIYKDEINNLQIGITSQHISGQYFWDNFKETQDYYGFRSNQIIHSAGLDIVNRFTWKIKKIGLFVEVELDLLYTYLFKQDAIFLDVQYEVWGSDCCFPLPIENQLKTNHVIALFGINGGIEFQEPEIIAIFIAFGINQNINSIFKDTQVSSLIPKHPPLHFISPSFTVGGRF